MLEREFGWTGISLELFDRFSSQWNGVRSNPCITCDATKVDLNALIEDNNLPMVIDFLQLDIDPASSTFKVLENIDFDRHSFDLLHLSMMSIVVGIPLRLEKSLERSCRDMDILFNSRCKSQ